MNTPITPKHREIAEQIGKVFAGYVRGEIYLTDVVAETDRILKYELSELEKDAERFRKLVKSNIVVDTPEDAGGSSWGETLRDSVDAMKGESDE